MKGLKHKCCEDQVKNLEWFSLEKRRLRGAHLPLYDALKGGWSQVCMGLVSFPKEQATGQEKMAMSCTSEGLDWT